MKYITPQTLTYKTIDELRKELTIVEHTLNYWHDKLEHRAFGEIKDVNLSYDEWKDIYTRNGWVEVSDFNCCYNPKSVTSPYDWASYELDKAYLTIWKQWDRYHLLWRFRLNKLEVERFDIRRVTQAPKITIDEALFIVLGLSPSVIGSVGFDEFSLAERRFEIDDIEYQDYEGNNLVINTALYSNDGLGHMEWFLKHKEEYFLIEKNEQFKCVSGRLFTKKFLKWAYKHNYLKEQVIKIRNTKDSPYGEKFASRLYNELLNEGVIAGQFEVMWGWLLPSSSLHYLANQLIDLELTDSKQQYKDIQKYVDYTSTHPLSKQYSETSDIEKVVHKADDIWKLYSEKNKMIDKALKTLKKREINN